MSSPPKGSRRDFAEKLFVYYRTARHPDLRRITDAVDALDEAGMDVRIRVAEGTGDELAALGEWLGGEGELRGRVRVGSGLVGGTDLGSIPDLLIVTLGAGGASKPPGHPVANSHGPIPAAWPRAGHLPRRQTRTARDRLSRGGRPVLRRPPG